MYFWKCWRDTRISFIVYLTMYLASAAAAVLLTAAVHDNEAGWSIVRGGSPERIAQIWRGARSALAVGAVLLGSMAGLGLGATGVGDEFQPRTLEFLLTRPRRRSYFIWTGWTAGAAQILVIGTLTVSVAVALLVFVTGSVLTWRIVGTLPLLCLGAVLVFGLTYFLTVLTRSGRHGLHLGLACVVVYPLLAAALEHWWQIKLPVPFDMVAGVAGHDLRGIAQPFPTAALAGWTAVAMTFPFAAQWLFNRADI